MGTDEPIRKKPLKRALIGFEIEMFTINRDGFIVNAADELLNDFRNKKMNLQKEISLSMVEIAGAPYKNVPSSVNFLLKHLEELSDAADKKDILLCPLGTYPGSYDPFMRSDQRYEIKKSIIGEKKYKIEGMCAGFHCHYTLPRGIFDSQLRVLKIILRSKIKESVVNSYNLLIAADPALTCFMQSSPYFQGEYIGKDSRVIMYRGGDALKSPNGLYADFEEFGGLPHYKFTTLDIMDIVTTRFEKWKSYIKSLGLNIKVLPLYGSILYTNWGPIRISAHGTIEQRGMDMNHPAQIAGTGVMIRFMLKKLQEDYYSVVPSEIGIKEPFKIENDTIYIPPFPYVRDVLQKLSAYKGLEDYTVY